MRSAALEAFFAEHIAREKLPGVSACLMGPEGELFSYNAGFRDAGRTKPVDGETMFGIASLSKSITSLAISLLACEGRLSWDDPVTRFFPDFRVPGAPRDLVTLRALASHTAGIPPMEPLEWSIAMNTPGRDADWIREMRASAPNRMNTIEQIIDYIRTCPYPTLGMPGEVMSYSNEGYAVLSYVVDKAAGIPLEEFCRQRIFLPLGMTRTIMDDDASAARALSGGNLTSLFEDDGEGGETCDDFWSVLPPFRGCATVKSTARDMAAYYRCLSLYGRHEGRQVLPREAVEAMIGAGIPAGPVPVYGLGLYKRTLGSRVLCEHGGGLHGVSSKGSLLLGEGYGLCVLCNHGDAAVERLEWALLNAVLGQAPETPLEWLFPAGREFADPEMLTGVFTAHEGSVSRLSVTLEDGRPVAALDGTAYELCYCGGSRFLARKDGRTRSRLVFLIRSGHAWGVRVGSRVYCAGRA